MLIRLGQTCHQDVCGLVVFVLSLLLAFKSVDGTSEDDEEVSAAAYAVLGLIGLSLVLGFAYCMLLLVRVSRKQPESAAAKPTKTRKPVQKPHRSQKQAAAAHSAPTQQQAQPAQPGVSIKTLLKQSKTDKSKAQAAAAQSKATQHGLYLNTLKGHGDAVTGLAFSHDGTALATACDDRVIRVYQLTPDITNKGINYRRRNLTAAPVDVAFGASPSQVAVTAKGTLEAASLTMYGPEAAGKPNALDTLWEVPNSHSGKPAVRLLSSMQSSTQGGVAVRSGTGVLLSCSSTPELRVYSLQGKQLATIDAGGLHNHTAAMSADARFVAAATFTPDVKVHELLYDKGGAFQSTRKVMDLKGHKSQVLAVDFAPDSAHMVTASKDGTWRVWNIAVRYHLQEDPKCILQQQQQVPAGSIYSQLAYGPSGVIAAACGAHLHLLDASTAAVIDCIDDAHDAEITYLQWSPVQHDTDSQGRTYVLASAGHDRKVRLWKAPNK